MATFTDEVKFTLDAYAIKLLKCQICLGYRLTTED